MSLQGSETTEAATNTNALNEMLIRVQHDKKKCVIPKQVLNLALKQVMSSWTCFRIRVYRIRSIDFGISNLAMTINQLRLH